MAGLRLWHPLRAEIPAGGSFPKTRTFTRDPFETFRICKSGPSISDAPIRWIVLMFSLTAFSRLSRLHRRAETARIVVEANGPQCFVIDTALTQHVGDFAQISKPFHRNAAL